MLEWLEEGIEEIGVNVDGGHLDCVLGAIVRCGQRGFNFFSSIKIFCYLLCFAYLTYDQALLKLGN